MPNWTSNHLFVLVPAAEHEALIASLSGPGDWFFPVRLFARDKAQVKRIEHAISALDRADLLARKPAIEARIRDTYRVPAAIRIDSDDVLAEERGKELLDRTKTVPISFARLAPMTDEEGRAVAALDGKSNAIVDDAILSFYKKRLGVKGTPIFNRAVVNMAIGPDIRLLHITFTTAWNRIHRIEDILEPVFARHDVHAFCAISLLEGEDATLVTYGDRRRGGEYDDELEVEIPMSADGDPLVESYDGLRLSRAAERISGLFPDCPLAQSLPTIFTPPDEIVWL